MICTCHKTCPKCDPGIEVFYQQKVKEAKEAVAAMKSQGVADMDYENLLDAKDIWYEYCQLRDQKELDEASLVDPKNIESPNSWE
jgi:hypothetical protein